MFFHIKHLITIKNFHTNVVMNTGTDPVTNHNITVIFICHL